jgi:hypothetical protein
MSIPEELPEGIRAGYLLDPGVEVPEGWERHHSLGNEWCKLPNPHAWMAMEARRISTPKTERVPWHEAFGFGMTVIADDGSRIRPNTAEICDDIVFLGDDNNINGGYVQTQAHGGTVEVLKENQ